MSKGKPTLHVTLYTVAIILFLLFLFNPFIVSRWVALHQNEEIKNPGRPAPAFIWPDSPGTFGDSYGALTSLFSFASFALLIYAFIREREDAAEEKKLLRDQITESRLKDFRDSLPFFILKRERESLYLTNAGHEVYHVRILTRTTDGRFISFYPPSPYIAKGGIWMEPFPFEEHIEFVLRVDYITQNGRPLFADILFASQFPEMYSCSDRDYAIQYEKERLLKEMSGQPA